MRLKSTQKSWDGKRNEKKNVGSSSKVFFLLVNMTMYNQLSYYHHDWLASTAVLRFYLSLPHAATDFDQQLHFFPRHIFWEIWFRMRRALVIYSKGWAFLSEWYFLLSDKLMRKLAYNVHKLRSINMFSMALKLWLDYYMIELIFVLRFIAINYFIMTLCLCEIK